MVPMRRVHHEIQDPDAIRTLIDAWQKMREGSAEHPVPLRLYLHSAADGRKARCFASSPRVAIEMDRELGVIAGSYACSYQSIMGAGTIVPVENADAKAEALARLMEHMAPGAPVSFPPEAVSRVAVWRIDVDELSGKERYPEA